jgi:hypothetical protein
LGEVVSEKLAATGARDEDLEWQATIPTSLGVSLSSNGTLGGVLKTSGEYQFEVGVRNKSTNSDWAKKKLQLTVNGETATACPTIKIRGGNVSDLAPAACETWDYTAEFEVVGGSPLYGWSAINVPTGLLFDPGLINLSGTPITGGNVTLQVTDGTGRIVQRDFEIPLRKKCWFGYLSDETGANRVHLFDPLLKKRIHRPATDSTDVSVVDFKFSPDGKFVAYRVKNADGNYRLSLWQAPRWNREYDFTLFGTSVTHYEWSKDSNVLAVSYTDVTGGTMLGGVNVATVDNGASAGYIQGYTVLEAAPASVDSELVWYGTSDDKNVAFHTLDKASAPFRAVGRAHLGTTGFVNVETILDEVYYESPVELIPGTDGFYAFLSGSGVADYRRNDDAEISYHGNDAVAPSGRYVAKSDGTNLKIYSARNSSIFDDDPEMVRADQCKNLIAWSTSPTSQEHLVCIGDDNFLWRHSLDTSSNTLIDTPITNSLEYATNGWSGYQRQVSPSGNWLALTTAEKLYVVSFGSASPTIVGSRALSPSEQTANIMFSPAEDFVVVRRGNENWLFNVEDITLLSANLGLSRSTAETCHEGPDGWFSSRAWCGSSSNQRQSAWSSDSKLFALVKDTGALVIQDLRQWSTTHQIISIQAVESCKADCMGASGFQP